MENLIAILISMIFVNNFILTKFLGLCPFFGVSKKTGNAVGMGFAVIFVMGIASATSWLLYTFVLAPLSLEFLQIITFILIIAFLVQLVEIFIKKYSDSLHKALGIYLPLITTNCAVLGVAFLNIQEGYSFLGSLAGGLGAGIGFMLALLLMSGIRERVELTDVPNPFRGLPIAFIIASLMSLAFLGFSGMLQ
ncbi:electron transport complex subunit RsxA [Candidatus Woesearchaeota archaeon]|nr:electron transport complex subunit RsxA [Candidatus Woesearchaeota archaeon]